MKIITNNQPRGLYSYFGLADKDKEQFDWIKDDEKGMTDFFYYRGNAYCFADLMPSSVEGWQGMIYDSMFSAILVRFTDDPDEVIVGLALF